MKHPDSFSLWMICNRSTSASAFRYAYTVPSERGEKKVGKVPQKPKRRDNCVMLFNFLLILSIFLYNSMMKKRLARPGFEPQDLLHPNYGFKAPSENYTTRLALLSARCDLCTALQQRRPSNEFPLLSSLSILRQREWYSTTVHDLSSLFD